MFKFDSYANLRAWTESAERHLWLERVKPHVVDDFKETVLTGLERWFTLPGHAGVPPPPPHKMALVTLAVVYPLSLTLGVLANRWLAPLAPALRSLVASAMMIVLMTWVIMPRVTRLLRRWLYPPD
jgi:antibiotic biosynthesis monooxygenase (ABM) superfamily enzyme